MMGSDSASTVSAEGPSKVESQMYNQLRKLINVVVSLGVEGAVCTVLLVWYSL